MINRGSKGLLDENVHAMGRELLGMIVHETQEIAHVHVIKTDADNA